MGLNWRIRQLGQNIVPLLVIGALAFGGWHLYQKGTFRHGLKPGLTSLVGKIPVFGSHLRKYINKNSRGSYVARSRSGKSAYKKSRAGRRGKARHHSRRHR